MKLFALLLIALPLAAQDAKPAIAPCVVGQVRSADGKCLTPPEPQKPTALTPEEDRALLVARLAAQSDQVNWSQKLADDKAGTNDQKALNESAEKYMALLRANQLIHKADQRCQWNWVMRDWIIVTQQANGQIVASACPLAEEPAKK